VIIGEFLARQQAINETKTLLRTFAHGDGNCAVEFHDRRWVNTNQPVVEQRDLAPVRGRRRGSLGVNCRNGRLQGVGTETARCKGTFGERDALGDLIFVPQRAILLVQQDQLSFRRASGGAARFLQQHESQQTHHLGFRKKVEEQSTETDRFAA
jgi:hypothetical protein